MQTPAVPAVSFLDSIAETLRAVDPADADAHDIKMLRRILDHGRTLPAPGSRVVIRSRGARGETYRSGRKCHVSRFEGEVGTLVEIAADGQYRGCCGVRLDSLVRYAPMDVVYLPLLDVAALPRRCQCRPGFVSGDCPMSYANGAHEDGLTFGLTEDEYQATL